MSENNLESYINKYNFLSKLPNVQLNFGSMNDKQKHPLEQVFLYHIFKELSKWNNFNEHNFYIIGANSPWDYTITANDVVLYLSNEDHVVPDKVRQAKAVFTPYCPFDYKKDTNIFPIPLGYNGSLLDLPLQQILTRKVDYFYSGNIYKKRIPFFLGMKWHLIKESLGLSKKSVNDVKFNRGFGEGFSPQEYSNKLMSSKIALVPEGYLSDVSFRFFEASKYGSIIITKKLYDYWFFKNFPGIELSSWKDLSSTINELLKSPEKMKKIQQDTLNYYTKYCSEKAVAAYIIKQLS